MRLDIAGLSAEELEKCRRILGQEKGYKATKTRKLRSGMEFFDAVFVIAVLKITPSLIRELSNFITKMQEVKSLKFKIISDDEKIIFEGKGTEEKIKFAIEEIKRNSKGKDDV
ncbi:hypothetical protein [Psychrosphaera algicola]|uniref:Uncharacterized protein n=1 Tax=Psychrosphaera algicola TaxID=3023714 RepID=A0ABT5FJY0_9GAMM|nr:hypothetical protein [Psychrosphaera sp. G1-22]MDC2891502.1 hypothetical protein [Psychrosphaera sp. G1-22]